MKTNLLLPGVLVVLTTGYASAQNDDCSGALPLALGVTPYSTVGATTSSPWPCAAGGSDIWYVFTATTFAAYTLDTCTNTTYDSALEVFSGADCNSLVAVTCNDDFCGLRSTASWMGTPGTTYFIRVGGFNGNTGTGELNLVEVATPPTNDECATASVAPVGTTGFNTSLGTLSVEPWGCASAASPDVWYTHTCGGFPFTIDLCGSAYDTALEIYTGVCGALTPIACNDDFCSLQSGANVHVPGGGTIYIRVGGFSTASSGFGLLNIGDSFAPPNDECAGALPIAAGLTLGSSVGSTTSFSWPCAAGGSDVWYAYTPSFSGDFVITTCAAGTTYDTALELFSGDCGSLTSLVCNDDTLCAFSNLRSRIEFCGVGGTTYFLRVGGFASGQGDFEIDLQGAPGPDPNQCATSLFASNNGGSVGGAVYFDATFSQAALTEMIAVSTTTAVGTPITAHVYTNPAGYLGNQGTMVGWTMVGSASGAAAAANTPSWLTLDAPILFQPGTVGVAIVATNFNHRYTNGTATNISAMSPDGVITLSLGSASNVPFTTPTFNPRVFNGTICHSLSLGTSYCAATPNSTGLPGDLIVGGSDCVSHDRLTLVAVQLPNNAFGYFLTSNTQGMSMPPNSQGTLCLGGDIGRGVGNVILNTGSTGSMRADSTLTLPHPSLGTVQVLAGETWNYQAWHRDSIGGVATSNLTDAVAVTYH